MKKSITSTSSYSGTVSDNGDGDISLKNGNKSESPSNQLEKELQAFDKRKVKITVVLTIEEEI